MHNLVQQLLLSWGYVIVMMLGFLFSLALHMSVSVSVTVKALHSHAVSDLMQRCGQAFHTSSEWSVLLSLSHIPFVCVVCVVCVCAVRAPWWPAWPLSWDRRWRRRHNSGSPPTTPPRLVIPAETKSILHTVYLYMPVHRHLPKIILKVNILWSALYQLLSYTRRLMPLYHVCPINMKLLTMSTCWLNLSPVFALFCSRWGSLRLVAPVRDEFCISNTDGLGVQNSRKQRLKFSSR